MDDLTTKLAELLHCYAASEALNERTGNELYKQATEALRLYEQAKAAPPAPADELRRLHNTLRVAEESLERCKAVCNATAEQWRADVAATPAPAPNADREAALSAGMQMGNSLGVSSLHAIRIIAAYELGLVPSGAATPAPAPEMVPAFRTSLAYDVGFLDGHLAATPAPEGQGKEASK